MSKSVNVKKEVYNYALLIAVSLLGAVAMHVFVYPSDFAPAGVDGIATMLQKITGVNAGIFTLALNFPLFAAAWLILKKKYALYTIVYITLTSVWLMLLESVGFYQYVTETDKLISALFSGLMLGFRTGVMIKIGGSTGGADIIACIVQSKRGYGNVERLISIICYAIIGVSFFVYKDLNCILLSVVQQVVAEHMTRTVLSPTRNAIEVKIVTGAPEEIRKEILFVLKHGATAVESKGMYTENGNSIIFSVINVRQIPEFMEMMKKYPDTFVYYSDVKGVKGNFRWKNDDEVK